MLIGSHVSPQDPLAAAQAENADVVQIFLGNPQSWKAPKPRDDAAQLKAAALPIYVHAPYLINVASANNRVRIPSRKILQDTCDAAAQIGAAAVIVHGGHVAEDNDLDEGFSRWRKALDQLQSDVPVYLESTAGGDHAMARHFDIMVGCGITSATPVSASASIPVTPGPPARRWSTPSTASRDHRPHRLVHCNDSKDRQAPAATGTPISVPGDRSRVAGGGGHGRGRAGDLRNGGRGSQRRHRVPAGEDERLKCFVESR